MESLLALPDVERIYSTLLRTAEATSLARLAVEYSIKEAAEVKTSFEFDLNWQNEPAAPYRQVITVGQQLFFLYGENILLAVIYYNRNAASALWFYKLQDFGEPNINYCAILPNGMVEFTHAVPDPTGPFQAHGPVIFASEGLKGECMMYADGVPNDASIAAGMTTWSFLFVNPFPGDPPPATLGLISLGRFNNGEPTKTGFLDINGAPLTTEGCVPIVTAANTATTWKQTVSDDVYMQIVADNSGGVVPPSVSQGGAIISVKGRCSVWSHYPCADVWDSITNYANGETNFVANNLTLWNPNKAVPMSAVVYGAKLLNPTDDVNIMRYCLGGDASQLITTLGPPSARKTRTWTHGVHTAVLPVDASWQSWIEVLSASSNNAASGIYDAKYRRTGSGLNGVQRSQVKCILLNCQGITNATVLEGMTVHARVASAWMYTSSKQSADQRMPSVFPDVWSRAMCIAQATYPVFEELDPNTSVKPLKVLMAEMWDQWRLIQSNAAARIPGQGVPTGLTPISERQQLKRQDEDEADTSLAPIAKLRRVLIKKEKS